MYLDCAAAVTRTRALSHTIFRTYMGKQGGRRNGHATGPLWDDYGIDS